MKKIVKRVMPIIMAITLILSNITPVFAEVSEHQHTSESTNMDTLVTYNQESKFSVIIPKHIDLGSDKTTNYTVTVSGDISSDDTVIVVPEESFLMKDISGGGKTDVTATVIQDKTKWTFNEFETIGNGNVSAPDLTAGNWEGSFWFNISLDKILPLTLSDDDLDMGAGSTYQVDAYIEGENVNELVNWDSSNQNIIVTDGLIETKASAKVGDTATITATYEIPQTYSFNSLNKLFGKNTTTVSEPEVIQAELTVTVIDINVTEVGKTETITEIDIVPGKSASLEATLIPDNVVGIVSWSTTAVSGINLVTSSNQVTIKVADDMEPRNSYYVVCVYKNLSKIIKVNIVPDHPCEYIENIVTKETCTTDGIKSYTCSICGYSYEEVIDASGHNYTSAVTAPTCTEQGFTTYTCSNCGDTYKDSYVAATGHTNETVKGYVATCTTTGLTDGVKCSVCNITLTAQTEIAAKGHTYGDWTTSLNPTCTVVGSKERTCSICGNIETGEVAILGHNWNSEFTVDKAATCTENGSKSIHCTRCSVTKDVTAIPATGHTSVNGGTKDVHTKCSTCGVTLSTAHSYTTSVSVAATCTSKGTTKYTCGCGYYYTDQNIAINSSNHTGLVVNGGIASVHTKYSCCGATVSTTHSYTVNSGVQYSAATCTAPRYNYKSCSCGYNPKSASYIVATGSAKGHAYSSYSTNTTQHWQACTNGCGTKQNLANHYDNGADSLCDVCGYKGTIVYTYHEHTGSSTSGTGCYTSANYTTCGTYNIVLYNDCSSCNGSGNGAYHSGYNPCGSCSGSGSVNKTDTCGSCGGTGSVTKTNTCRSCEGSGSVTTTNTCGGCNGSGSVSGSHNSTYSDSESFVCDDCGASYTITLNMCSCGGWTQVGTPACGSHGMTAGEPCKNTSETCGSCNGSGSSTINSDCSSCNALGTFTTTTDCGSCDGSGSTITTIDCGSCNGSGKGSYYSYYDDCLSCNGTGKGSISGYKCTGCSATSSTKGTTHKYISSYSLGCGKTTSTVISQKTEFK